MSKIGLLTNRTRAEQRPPLLPNQVSADLLARLLPVVRRPKMTPPRQAQVQAQPQARTEQPVRRKPVTSRSGAPGAAKYTPQKPPANGTNGRPLNGSPHNGNSTYERRPGGAAPAKPVPSSTPNGAPKPGSGGRPTAAPPPQPRNGSPHSSQPSSVQREEYKPSRPVQMPLESPAKTPADLNRGAAERPPNSPAGSPPGYQRSARLSPSEPPKTSVNQPHFERPQPSSIANHNPIDQEKQPERPQAAQPQKALLPALKQIFNQQPDLPAHAAVLGVGEDGFPVLLDVFDPTPGALVVIGDERKQQLTMLRSAVASLAMRASPRAVQVMVLSCEPESWREWMREQGYERFSVGIEGVDDMDSLQEWILRFGDWIEQRRLGQRSGPPILVVMDTLSFLPRLSHDIRLNFEWMIKEGPPAQIWPLAAISSELAQLLSGRHLLRSFPTRVLGFVDRPDFYVQFAGLTPQAAQKFAEPGVFAVQVGDEWLRLRLAGR